MQKSTKTSVDKTPVVSIILCTYNRESILMESIDSVLKQTYQDWELIIIDDGSTDGTKALLDSLEDPRIHCCVLEENMFYCYAANYGIRKMKGSYMAVINSDDLWQPDKLEKQITWMEAHSEYGACFTRVSLIGERGECVDEQYAELKAVFQMDCHTQSEWLHHFLWHGNYLCHPSAVIRKKVLDEVGGYNLLFCQSADYDLWVRIVTRYPIYIYPEPLTLYRWGDGKDQVSSREEHNNYRFFNEQMLIRRQMIERMDDEEFTRFFKEDFRNPFSASHTELLFERAFLMMECMESLPEQKMLGIEWLERALREPDGADILKQTFGMKVKELYGLQKESLYMDYFVRDKLILQKADIDKLNIRCSGLEKENRILKAENHRLQKSLQTVLDSTIWRSTALLRKILDQIKGGRHDDTKTKGT